MKKNEKTKIASLHPSKGKLFGRTFYVWDKIRSCDPDRCQVGDDCPYQKRGNCTVEYMWLKAAMEPFEELLEKVRDPFLMQWVGSHIIPLYHQLLKFQMEELKVNKEIVYNDAKGVKKVHPIYKEMRDTMTAISHVWQRMGLYEIAQKAGFFKPIDEGESIIPHPKEIMKRGEKGYYEAMSKSQRRTIEK